MVFQSIGERNSNTRVLIAKLSDNQDPPNSVFCPIDAPTSPISPSNASPPRASHWSLLQRVSLNRSPILPTPSYTRPKSLVPPLPIRRSPTVKRPPSLKRQMSEFLDAQSGQTPDPPSSAPGSTDKKVAKLQQGSSAHHMPPDPHQTGNPGNQSRFSQPQPDTSFHQFTGQEFDHLKRIEPLKIPELWFAGDAVQLTSFLRSIRDFLQPRGSLFQNESRRVVWVSCHFGFCPLENKRHPAPTENWYNSLVLDNARQQGVHDQYADLDVIPFCLPQLQSVEALLGGLIAIFGDKFSKENAKRALAACKQRNLTIGEYNAQFSSLVYLVEDVPENQIEKYVSGLNPRIIRKAMSKQWRDANTLRKQMELATEEAAQLNLLALLPPEPGQHHAHTPLSTNQPPGLPNHFPAPPPPQRDPDAMEIDALGYRPGSCQASILNASRAICRTRRLCFCCLQPIVPVTHTGSLNFLNPPISLDQRKALIDKCKAKTATTVSAVQTADTAPLSYCDHYLDPSPDPNATPFESEDLHHGLDKIYKDYEEAEAATVPVSTVQVRLDCSAGGRILFPALFKAPGGILIPATILVNTGLMANFVNEGFIRKHDLRTQQQKSPIRCVGFDGRKGVGGLVTQDWVGMIQLSSIDSTPVLVPSSFGITRLGSVDAIFGLPWLDRQGWVASGSVKGGHHFSLGSTPLYVIESSTIGGEPKGKLCAPSA
ncbi:hypothetical protein PCANC_18628 [Puccinia coronata f. sp. avenae]|uniref:Retrotransposon gag domain-containing protein n=1 Tax=Puccinia coronata f. sp. avenae TaxID=200324 RepID=A0A2N5SIU5_9BASI|nr:hypothetical protein PCANC_18628 [Puccinia coronata f. sp. avenae]